jgi:hypothetical protein
MAETQARDRASNCVIGPQVRATQHTDEKREDNVRNQKIVLSAAIVVSIALGLMTTTAAFANAPGGAYIQCDGGKSSPVRCTPDSW